VGRLGVYRTECGPAALRECAPQAKDFTNRKGYRHAGLSAEERARNRTKSRVRAKVEHSIGVINLVFGFSKVRYRGLEKNAHRLFVTCALANLFMARHHLLRCRHRRIDSEARSERGKSGQTAGNRGINQSSGHILISKSGFMARAWRLTQIIQIFPNKLFRTVVRFRGDDVCCFSRMTDFEVGSNQIPSS
jgi:hypothetical protein